MEKELGEPVLKYSGEIYVRPCSRGVCLMDLPDDPQLEDLLPEGEFLVDIVVRRKTPNVRAKRGQTAAQEMEDGTE